MLPTPRNDFEIVVPEKVGEEGAEGKGKGTVSYVEDAGDLDERRVQRKREEGTYSVWVWWGGWGGRVGWVGVCECVCV